MSRAIAVAQTCPIRGDVQSNLDEHLRLTALASAWGARVVLFPELSLTGYELDVAEALAFTERDTRLDPLRAAARAASVHIVAGAPVRIGPRLHIGAFIIYPDGASALYTKQRLGAFSAAAAVDGIVPAAECTVFDPGVHDAGVPFGSGTASLAICADIGDPDHARRAADSGAAAYLAGMFVIPSEFESDAARLHSYATRHSMLVAMANFGSASGGLAAAGRSSIWSASGELLARLAPDGAGIAVAIEEDGRWRARTAMTQST